MRHRACQIELTDFSSVLIVLSILIPALFLFCLVVDLRISGDSTTINQISLWFETFDLFSTFLHSASHFLVFFHGYESNQEASERYCKDGWRQQSNVLCSSAPTWRGQAIPFAWNSKVGSTAGAAQVQVLGMFIWVWWVWWGQIWNPDFLCLLWNVLQAPPNIQVPTPPPTPPHPMKKYCKTKT